MENLVELSLEIAEKYHAGQTRWDKKTPYISHPIAVSGISAQYYKDGLLHGTFPIYKEDEVEIIKCIAILHDILEDCEISHHELYLLLSDSNQDSYESLVKINTIVLSVRAITKNPDKNAESYLEYILRVKNDNFARLVKICDIIHNNSDLKPGSMRDKYLLAKYILENQ